MVGMEGKDITSELKWQTQYNKDREDYMIKAVRKRHEHR